MTRRFRPWRWYGEYGSRRLQGFGMLDAARLASGRPCERGQVYNVPVWLYGRRIATVRVPGANAYGAERFALRYLSASLYPHKTVKSSRPLPPGAREITLAATAEAEEVRFP